MSYLDVSSDQARIAAGITFADMSQSFAPLSPSTVTMSPPLYSNMGTTTTTIRGGARNSAPPALTLKCSNTPRVRFSSKLAAYKREQQNSAGPHSSWHGLSMGDHTIRQTPTELGLSCNANATDGYHLANQAPDERQAHPLETKASPRTFGSFGIRSNVFKIPGISSSKRNTNMTAHTPDDGPFHGHDDGLEKPSGDIVQQPIQGTPREEEPRSSNHLDSLNAIGTGEKDTFTAEMDGQQMDMRSAINSAVTETSRNSTPTWNKNAPLPPLPLRAGVNASPSNALDLEWGLQSEAQKGSISSISKESAEMIIPCLQGGIGNDGTQSSINFYSNQFDQALDKIIEQSQTQSQNFMVPISPAVQQAILDSLMKDAQPGGTSSPETTPSLAGDTTDQPKEKPFIVKSRKHSNSDDDGNGSDESDGRLSKRPRHPDPVPVRPTNGLRFGCPFHSHDPKNYDIYRRRSCASAGFESISRLKEHLYRHHMAPIHCIRCYCTFQTHEGLKSHLMAPKGNVCKIRVGQVMEGITEDVERQLKSRKKTTPRQTDKERWEDIYRLLFPNAEAVPSPYFEPLPQELLQTRISQKMASTSEYRGQAQSPEPTALVPSENLQPYNSGFPQRPVGFSQGSTQPRARKLSSKPTGAHIALQLQSKQLGQQSYEPPEPAQANNPPVELTFSSPPPESALHYSPTHNAGIQGPSIHRYSPSVYSDHGCDTNSSTCTCPSPCSCPLGDMPSTSIQGTALYDFDYDYDYELMNYLQSNVGSVDYSNQPLIISQEPQHELPPSLKPQMELPFAVEELYAKLNDLLEINNFSDSDASTSIGMEQDQWWS